MTRYQLTRAARRISKLLDECGLKEALKESLQRLDNQAKSEASPTVIDAYQAYSSLSRQFGDAERRVLKALKLGFLQHTDFWVQFLQDKLNITVIRNILERIFFAQKYLPGMVDLLKSELEQELEKPLEQRNEDLLGKELLTVATSQEHDEPVPLSQVQELLTAVEAFYDACAMVVGADQTLSYLGSEVCFGMRVQFVGGGEPVKLIKRSVLSIWDRRHVMLNHPHGFCAHDQTQDIPVFALLSEKAGRGEISPMQAEQIKAMLCEALELFLRAGASIPELDRLVQEDSDLLMTLNGPQAVAQPSTVVPMPAAPAAQPDAEDGAADSRLSAWESERDMLLKLVEERSA